MNEKINSSLPVYAFVAPLEQASKKRFVSCFVAPFSFARLVRVEWFSHDGL